MKDGYIKCAGCGIDITVANPRENAKRIIEAVNRAESEGVDLLCMPELCLTGYSCGELFLNSSLINAAEEALFEIAAQTSGCNVVFALGLPIRHYSKLYNCAAVVCRGEILGLVPKTHIPMYGDLYEGRYFESGSMIGEYEFHRFACGVECSIGKDMLFSHESLRNYIFGVEICEDLWVAQTPSLSLCQRGAKIILNLSASYETVGKAEYRHLLVASASAKLLCGYVYANAMASESTQDAVFASHNMIYECGDLLAESKPFAQDSFTTAEIDVDKLSYERARINTFKEIGGANFTVFSQEVKKHSLTRAVEKNPFVPSDKSKLSDRCELIFSIQAHGLLKRIQHTNTKKLVLGISGGLDSTLALLVAVKAFDLCGRPHKDIITVTMPCFGTTSRTKSNAQQLCECFGTDFREVDISESVRKHFADIGHDECEHDAAYENAQARERTQVLMDIANQEYGMVIGTGDLSELALGWCTYNGDQMSMYGVNGGVPKTLIKHIVKHEAQLAAQDGEQILSDTLFDILDTPVSPELLPPDESGAIAQKTEDIVGPYELHDFFLYYTVRYGFSA
ncbi:MAG: NAD(+) synthase, partial [Clostridia bacterium]|nr:NAD(+) synthase [Clostridia bacterium]